ncbi:hypothetical protein M231_06219 [Tremella mesenterica]|uniref:Uncharacterized protein n=1 Tax=Tremella mesenterica TaxID=5217 RepID=A0A4Q1BCD2_TREME|nr:hypothetical protein M231_06219 [Tremella mesenterica]
MARPTVSWIGYNFFRLTAVIFLTWAFVAQFLALASDIQAKNHISTTLVSQTIAADTGQSSSSSASLTSVALTSTTASLPPIVLGEGSSTPSITADAGDAITATTTATSSILGLEQSLPTYIPGERPRRFYGRRAFKGDRVLVSRDEIQDSGWVAGSSLPDQPGGTGFAILSRLIIAVSISILILAQVGSPEDFLYHHLGWLGPQSTTLFLGLLQIIISVENLRTYEKKGFLIPAWALLVIGSLNVVFGLILRLISRRMPKTPPPALWFNISHRFFFWTRLPKCYAQLFQKPKPASDLEDDEKQDIEEGLITDPVAAMTQEQDPSKVRKPRGERDASREDRHGRPEERKAKKEGLRRTAEKDERLERYRDVRQGGYPTFSGNDPNTAGRHVPAGTLERGKDGREVYLNEAEKARAMKQPLTSRQPKQLSTGNPVIEGARRERRSPPRPLTLAQPKQEEYVAKPESSTLPKPNIPPQVNSVNEQVPAHLTPGAPSRLQRDVSTEAMKHRSATVYDYNLFDEFRKSVHSVKAAATDLGPQFPLPPNRLADTNSRGQNGEGSSQSNVRASPGSDALVRSPSGTMFRRPPQRQTLLNPPTRSNSVPPQTSMEDTTTVTPNKILLPSQVTAALKALDQVNQVDKDSKDEGDQKKKPKKARELSSGNQSATASAPSKRSMTGARFELSPLSEVSEDSHPSAGVPNTARTIGIKSPSTARNLDAAGVTHTPSHMKTPKTAGTVGSIGSEGSVGGGSEEEVDVGEKATMEQVTGIRIPGVGWTLPMSLGSFNILGGGESTGPSETLNDGGSVIDDGEENGVEVERPGMVARKSSNEVDPSRREEKEQAEVRANDEVPESGATGERKSEVKKDKDVRSERRERSEAGEGSRSRAQEKSEDKKQPDLRQSEEKRRLKYEKASREERSKREKKDGDERITEGKEERKRMKDIDHSVEGKERRKVARDETSEEREERRKRLKERALREKLGDSEIRSSGSSEGRKDKIKRSKSERIKPTPIDEGTSEEIKRRERRSSSIDLNT